VEPGYGPTTRFTSIIAIHYGYDCHMKVSVAEAKNKLPKLIKAVEDGESVAIYRHGLPVVDIVRTTKAGPEKPKFGTLKGKVTELDPDWWKPMTDDEVEALVSGCMNSSSSLSVSSAMRAIAASRRHAR
jgi:prevent-host-death family protein